MEVDPFKAYKELVLDKVYSQQIQQNEEHIKTWTQYRDRHKKIIEGLKTISLELSMNCIVPIGKRALMKGKLSHTSEILVCIGDGYFAKYSTHQAIALCDRRIKHSEELIKQFEKERNLLEIRQMLPLDQGAFAMGDCKNLIEHWDDKKLEDWRAEHKKKEREYRQKLAKLKQQKKTEIVTEDDLFKRLDELELEEELDDELNRLEEEKNQVLDQHSQSNKTDEELDEELNEELDEELNEESEEELDEESDDKLEESDEKRNEVHLEQIPENQKKLILNETDTSLQVDQSTCLNELAVQSDQQSTSSSELVDIKEVKEIVKLCTESTEESSNKDTKINGKFEVSIIKEDEVEKTLGKQNYPTAQTHQKQKVKKNTRFVSNESDCSESDTHSEKIKGSGRRVSFAEPHFIEVESDSILESTSDDDINETYNEKAVTNETDNNADDDDIIRISFTHSKVKPSFSENTDNNITNPGDIYRIFSKPKSILKKSPDVEHVNKNISFVNDDSEEQNIESDVTAKSTYNIVVHDVQERDPEKTVTQSNEVINKNRKKSRFKLERSNIKQI